MIQIAEHEIRELLSSLARATQLCRLELSASEMERLERDVLSIIEWARTVCEAVPKTGQKMITEREYEKH